MSVSTKFSGSTVGSIGRDPLLVQTYPASEAGLSLGRTEPRRCRHAPASDTLRLRLKKASCSRSNGHEVHSLEADGLLSMPTISFNALVLVPFLLAVYKTSECK